MKKINSIPLILRFIVLSLLIISLNSCSDDNPVIPPIGDYQFDSARYDWTTDTLPASSHAIFGFDTSHIYILEYNYLNYYNGKDYVRYQLNDAILNTIDGLDPNNIFIAGSFSNGGYRLVKWNGVSFNDIPVPINAKNNSIFVSIFVRSNNEIWLGAKGKIFLYDGLNFTEFLVDSTDVIKYITENDGRILASGRRFICPDSNFINCDAETYVYQYENTNWTKIYSIYKTFNEPEFFPVEICKKLNGNMQEGIFNFIGSDFSKVINSPSPYLITFVVDGKNINELTTVAFSNNEQFFINWNGSKWSKEFADPGGIIEIKN